MLLVAMEVVVAEIDEATGMVDIVGTWGRLVARCETLLVVVDIGDSDAVVAALALLVEQMVVMAKHYLLGPIRPPICTVLDATKKSQAMYY